MKTITAIFTFPDASIVAARASFKSIPGTGDVYWNGNTQAIIAKLDPPWNAIESLPLIGYAETFTEAMQGLADKAGARLVITNEGEWEVFEE